MSVNQPLRPPDARARAAGRRAWWRACVLAALLLSGGAAAAAGPGGVTGGFPVVGSPMGGGPMGGNPMDGAGSAVTTQSMVWTGGSRLSLGLGIEQRAAPLLPRMPGSLVNGDAGLLIGLGLATGSRTRLTWQTPLLRADGADAAGAPRQMRMGLVFTLHDPYADLRRGLLTRIELSGQTALALRSRGGRLGLTLTSQW